MGLQIRPRTASDGGKHFNFDYYRNRVAYVYNTLSKIIGPNKQVPSPHLGRMVQWLTPQAGRLVLLCGLDLKRATTFVTVTGGRLRSRNQPVRD